jgi:cobalamin biosynthesis protein CbiD
MRDETPEHLEQLAPRRTGLTTGSCATATSLAAARWLLMSPRSEHADIGLPKLALSVVPESIGVECFAIDRQGRIVRSAQ